MHKQYIQLINYQLKLMRIQDYKLKKLKYYK